MDDEEVDPGNGVGLKVQKTRRKRTSTRKCFTRPKKRGQYKAKSSSDESSLQTISRGDPELAECLLSDEEERAEFLRDIQSATSHIECQNADQNDDQTTSYWPASSSESHPECSTTSENSGSVLSIVDNESTEAGPVLEHILVESCEQESNNCPSQDKSIEHEHGSEGIPEQPVIAPVEEAQLGDTPSTGHPEIVERALSKLRSSLPSSWIPTADRQGVHLLQICNELTKAVKKQVTMTFDGAESIFIHRKPLSFAKDILSSVSPGPVKLEERHLESFIRRGCAIAKRLYAYEVCVGANVKTSKTLWELAPDSYIDLNSFGEETYDETCRSTSCLRLIVLGKGKRCNACSKLQNILRKRVLPTDSPHPSTNNRFLTPDQAQQKLKLQQEDIKRKDKQIAYLKQRIHVLLEHEGVDIDQDMSQDLAAILKAEELSEVQRMFIGEQLKYVNKKDKRGMRWHPTMIRLALSIKMTSPKAYDSLRDSGAINLPSSRTLYDYSRPFPPQVGVLEGLLKMTAEKVSKLEYPKKLVTLIVDEVSVSRNLVYRQSDGVLLGYVHLEEVEKELIRFESCLSGTEEPKTSHLATKILAYMVKGVLSNVKCVIAAYPCNQLSKDTLFSRNWRVISRLERAGIPVLVLVGDGCSVNRAFIRMHKAITITKSGIIFDTVNVCAPDRRPLFFMSDVAHLIKTIRNCFYNSGTGEKKTRCLELDGENIVWATIVRLYLSYKQFNLRKSYKLSALNVFPNSYSFMKVHLAAEVISNTVALDIEQQNWANTKQTVKFLRMHNKFFDILNGAHTSQHIRTRNEDLAPYTDLQDPRFHWLSKTYFEDYMEYWRNQATAQNICPQDQNRKMLSAQTREGIEISIRGFTSACKFVLETAGKHSTKVFIMARAFSQDDLEHHFSRQRAAGGGNTNMNVSQFLGNQVSIGIIRDVGLRHKGSNVESQGRLEVTTEPLPKKRSRRTT